MVPQGLCPKRIRRRSGLYDIGQKRQTCRWCSHRLHDGWVLYARYDGKGYTRTVTVIGKYNNGTEKVRIVTKWTQKGREFIIKLLEKAYALEGSED